MKWLLMILMAFGGGAPALAQAQPASREERILLPLTAEQQAANALLNEEIRRVEEAYARQKAGLEAQVSRRQAELIDRNQAAELQPCTQRLAAANQALESIETERKRLLQGQTTRFPSLAELDKQRGVMYWDRDAVRSDCEVLRKRLDAERPGRVAAEVRKVLPGELRKLERDHENRLASLKQRRYRQQPAPRQVAEPSKPQPPKPPPVATAEPPDENPEPAPSSTGAQRGAPAAPPPAKSAKSASSATTKPVTPPAPQAKDDRAVEKPSPAPTASSSAPAPAPSPAPSPATSAPSSAPSPAPSPATSPVPSPSPFAADSETSDSPGSKSRTEEPFILVRAVAGVTAMFQSAQDAVVGLVTDTPGEKLSECASGKNSCPSSVYAALLRGMKRDAVLKALGPPKKLERPDPDLWGYILPASDTSPAGFAFLVAFVNDKVADIKPVARD